MTSVDFHDASNALNSDDDNENTTEKIAQLTSSSPNTTLPVEKDSSLSQREEGAAASGIRTSPPLSCKKNDCRPPMLKKARTAYFIFMEEKRPQVQATHPGEGVAGHAKVLGQMWSSMSADDKQVYQLRAAAEREEVSINMESMRNAGISTESSAVDASTDALILPLPRVKKIIKLDPEVKGVSKEALLLIARSAELFTAQLGMDTLKIAQIQNRRTILPDDLVDASTTKDCFVFLREDLKDLARDQQQERVTKKASTHAVQQQHKEGSKSSDPKLSNSNTKPLTAYFGFVSAKSS